MSLDQELNEYVSMELAQLHTETRVPYNTLEEQYEEVYLGMYLQYRFERDNPIFLTFQTISQLKERHKNAMSGL